MKYMCAYFGVSRSGYYAWRSRRKPNRAHANEALLCRIEKIHTAGRETGGGPRVHAALRKGGLRVARTRLERSMCEAGIKARTARIYRRLAGLHRF